MNAILESAPCSADKRYLLGGTQVERKMDLVPSACVVFVGAIAAFAATAEVQEPPRLKQAGERLVAGLPRPNWTAAELAVPCVND